MARKKTSKILNLQVIPYYPVVDRSIPRCDWQIKYHPPIFECIDCKFTNKARLTAYLKSIFKQYDSFSLYKIKFTITDDSSTNK